jgi:hypothetical protein
LQLNIFLIFLILIHKDGSINGSQMKATVPVFNTMMQFIIV